MIAESLKSNLIDDCQVIEIPVHFIVIQAVANHEDIWNGEADIVCFEPTSTGCSLLHEGGHSD